MGGKRTGDESLSEEAIYLAAGYRSMVVALWSVKDTLGPVVAESFYKAL